MKLTPEQEAELARKIEEKANAAAGRQSLPLLKYKPRSEELDIDATIKQLEKEISDRMGWRNYL